MQPVGKAVEIIQKNTTQDLPTFRGGSGGEGREIRDKETPA